MVQIWEKCKSLQLISPENTDHAMFIWRGKPVFPFSKNLSRHQNSEILLSLNVNYIIKLGYRRKHEMQVASKKVYGKNNSVPNTCNISPLKKMEGGGACHEHWLGTFTLKGHSLYHRT